MKIALVFFNSEPCVSRGAGYIASVVLTAGYDLTFIDTFRTPSDQAAVEVCQGEYDLLLISASTVYHDQIIKLAEKVKQEKPGILVLLGGMHATVTKGSILQECSSIDYACIGEGEDFILDFLSHWDSKMFHWIRNLAYRDDKGAVHVNHVRPCTDLDLLPEFKFDLFHLESVVQPYPFPGFCYVYATRGCPYNCTYCCNGVYLELYSKNFLRTRRVDEVIAELIFLKKNYQVEFLYFGDEMIVFDEEYVTELFRRVQKEVLLPYGCMARVEKITPAIVELFRKTGCRYVGMGVECGDEKFRKEFLNRHMTNQQIIDAFQALRGIEGMYTTSYNMQGYPVPNDDDLTKATVELNRIAGPNNMQMSVFYPFPGTKLYDYCVEHDLIDFSKLYSASTVYAESALKEIK